MDAKAAAVGIPPELEKKVAIYDIAGPLFFGAAQKAMGSLGVIGDRIKVLIIRLDHVPVMDATGLVALESAIATLSKHGCTTVLTGLQAQPRALIERAGVTARPWKVTIQADLVGALDAARGLV
jgi:SulP family sulfate permease